MRVDDQTDYSVIEDQGQCLDPTVVLLAIVSSTHVVLLLFMPLH